MAQAFIFSASAGLVSATANTATALADATSSAKASAGNLDVTGNITITNTADSVAEITIENMSTGYATVGIMVGYARAKGTFEAILESTGTIYATGTVKITNTWNGKAESIVSPANGGVDASIYSGKVNHATSDVQTTVNTGIQGSGSIGSAQKRAGSITITTTGKAVSNAKIVAPLISFDKVTVVSNSVTADLTAVQNTFVQNVTLYGSSLTMVSDFNKDLLQGAIAELGGNSLGSRTDFNLVGVNTNVAIATMSAQNLAFTKDAGLDLTGDLTLESDSTSYAEAKLTKATGSISGLSLGVNVLKAYANGIFNTSIDAGTHSITAKKITVQNKYTAQAIAETSQPNLGIKGSFGDINTNVALAETGVKAEAVIRGSGIVTAKGEVNVTVTGTANAIAKLADAAIQISGVDIAVNVVNAELKAEQEAGIDGVTLDAGNNAVNVISKLNEAVNGTAPDGAVANASANNSLLNASLVNGEVHTATAKANAKAKAYINQASVNAGNVTILTSATSNAYAGKGNAAASLSLIGLGVLVMNAEADGEFKSWWTAKSNSSSVVKDISIKTIYTSKAYAISAQPKGGVSVDVAKVSVNHATANASTVANAYMGGSGTVHASNVDIQVEGDADAEAEIESSAVSVGIAAIATSVSTVNLSVAQSAYIEGPGKNQSNYEGLVATGYVHVISNLNVNGKAETGANKSDDSASLSLVEGTYNRAEAISKSVNSAYIKDAVVTAQGENGTEGIVKVAANTISQVKATAKQEDVSIKLVGLGFVNVMTSSDDTTEAYVSGLSKVTGNKVEILAETDSDVIANASIPTVSVSVANSDSVKVITEAGKNGGIITKAWIGSGSEVYVTSNTSLNVKASSDLNLEAQLPDDVTNISGVALTQYNIQTYVGKTETKAYINGYAESANDMVVLAESRIFADTRADLLNAGLAAFGTSKAGNTVIDQITEIGIGDNAVLKAWGNISAKSVSKLNLSATIQDKGYGAATNCAVETFNTATRHTNAVIGNNVQVISVVGNIEILATEDKSESILDSSSIGSSGAAYAGGGPDAYVTYYSYVNAIVGKAGRIEAKYGTLDVKAIANSTLRAYAYRKAAAVAGSNKSYAIINSNINVYANFGTNTGDADDKTVLLGEITTIGAYIESQDIYSHAVSYTASAGSNTRATAVINAYNTLKTTVYNAYVGGIETLNVETTVEKQRIKSETYAEIIGFTGKVYATSTINGYNHVDVEITRNAELAGKVINVIASAPEITNATINRSATAIANTVIEYVWEKVKTVVEKVVKVVSKIPIIGWFVKWVVKKVVEWIDVLVEKVFYSDAESIENGNFTNIGNIVFNGIAHVGGGAAGIFVDIFEGQIKASGLDTEITDNFVTTNGDTVTIKHLYNNDVGKLNMDARVGNISGTGTLISNAVIPLMQIINHTDLHLVLKNFIFLNTDAEAPDINTNAAGNDNFKMNVDEHTPNLTVETKGKGNVTFAKESSEDREDFDLGEGVLTIKMDEEDGGNLYTTGGAFVAANKIHMEHAANIGSSSNPFKAYVFDISGYDGTGVVNSRDASENEVFVKAKGDIFLQLTLVKEWMTSDQMTEAEESGGIKASLNLNNVESIGNGTVFVDIQAPMQICAGKPTADEDYEITIPRSQMDYVTLPGTKGQTLQRLRIVKTGGTQINDADGNATDFWLTSDGMLMNVNSSIEFNGQSYLIEQANSEYDTYLLPNGATVVVDKNGKLIRVVNRISSDSREDYGSGIFELSNMDIQEKNGNITITITGSGAEYDQKITFKDGIAYMQIGQNGAVTYIEGDALENGTGWKLPNGIVIFYKQAFLNEKNNTVVEGNFIKKDGDNLYILLEDINETGRTS